jgi:apolipoprotein N-acyltransferase
MSISPLPGGWKGVLIRLGLVIMGALLFAGSHPNLLVSGGIPLFGWIAFIPVFYLICGTGTLALVFWGALYGYAAYGLFNYWLSVFHPLAGLIVGSIYLVYFAVLFPVLKLAVILFPKRGYIVQWVIWIAYEYLRTLGFLGYPYGNAGYSQWQVLPVIQIAAVFGVWGVSALVVFPSAALAAALKDWRSSGSGLLPSLGSFFRRERIPLCLWAAALAAALVYGFGSRVDYRTAPVARIALVQHNTDPWRGGLAEYRKNYEVLKRLSLEALNSRPKPDLVVWSETAFVPRIYWHTTYRDDPGSYALVKELIDFFSSQEVPFLIGNDDARRELNALGYWEQVDYNATMLFQKGINTRLYRKLHLVPFTEHFPYQKELPWVYTALRNADTHFWEKGDEATVFDAGGFKFSTPICFEDVFGYLSRDFVRNGAEVIVNLSNDAWSHSLPAQMQHLSMAVFRAVENRRSMVRSTASGQTCALDPNGKVLAMAEPFTEAYLIAEVPVVTPDTPYTSWGDVWAKLFAAAAFALLIIGIGRGIIHRGRRP